MIDCKDILMSFYKDKKSNRPKIDLSYIQSFTEVNITTLNIGLGDAIVLTSLRPSRNKKLNIYSPNRHWDTLCKFNNFLNPIKFYRKNHWEEEVSSEIFKCDLEDVVNYFLSLQE